MAELAQPVLLPRLRFPFSLQKAFLLSVAILASTVLLKVASIQYLEVIYFVLIFVLLLVFVHRGYRVTWFRVLMWLALAYTLFCGTALCLAVASLRFEFYLPVYLPPLRAPVVITIARIAELAASLTGMFYMAQLFGNEVNKAKFTMQAYFWTGFASGIYSFLSIPLSVAGAEWAGAYSSANRLRGFYNEGGPYGLYVLSVLAVGFAIDRLGWVRRGRIRLAMALMCVVFVMCYSKAGVFAVLSIFALNGLFARRALQRVAILGVGIAVLVGLSQIVNLPEFLRNYQATAAQYERLSHFHPKDPNFVYGRVAGAFIVPRMIEEHPLTGIGWGNYGVLRNAPEYRGAAVFVEDADDPGLGSFGVAAELGLPLFAFLMLCLLVPFFYLRWLHVPVWLTNLALIQPVVHIFGAQLNLTYPWVTTAFALGLGFAYSRTHGFTTGHRIEEVS